jgi:hypothetical protein
MKFFIALISTVLLTNLVIAENDAVTIPIVGVRGVTNSATSGKLSGKLDSIYLNVGQAFAGVTQTVSIAINNETLLSVTPTNDTPYRPATTLCDYQGVAVGNATNKQYVPYLLVEDIVTVTWSATNTATSTNLVTIKLSDK